MDHAQRLFPTLALDPKRIAGNTVAIAVHIGVLMVLMIPMTTAPRPGVVEETRMEAIEIKPPPPPIPPPLPINPRPTPVAPPQPAPPQQTIPVDDAPSVVDVPFTPVDDPPAMDTFAVAVAPAFAQISADVAPAPPYPAQALRRRLTGEVTLRVRVDVHGQPLEVSIENSSGHRLLDEAARKFVLARWHFVPAMQGGQPVEAFALVPVNFVIPY